MKTIRTYHNLQDAHLSIPHGVNHFIDSLLHQDSIHFSTVGTHITVGNVTEHFTLTGLINSEGTEIDWFRISYMCPDFDLVV